jgi:hypothetical protein
MLSLLRTSGQFLARLLLPRRYVHASQHPIHTSQAPLCLFILQYMTLRNRKVVLERVAASYTASKEQSLPLLLNKMTIRAATLKEAAMTAQSECFQQLAALGVTQEDALHDVALRMTPQHESNTLVPMTDKMKHASAWLEHRYLCNDAVADLPPGVVVLKSAGMGRTPSQQLITKLERLKHGLGVQVYGANPPASIDDERLQQAVAELAAHEIQQLQFQLVHGGQEYQLLDHLISQLSGRPQEQGKLQKSKRTLEPRLKHLLEKCTAWLRGDYRGYEKLPDDLKAHRQSVNDWTVGKNEI